MPAVLLLDGLGWCGADEQMQRPEGGVLWEGAEVCVWLCGVCLFALFVCLFV